MSSNVNVHQIISLAKRFLLPQVRKWWNERKKRKQQEQQGQHGQAQQGQYNTNNNNNQHYSQQQQPPQGGYYQQQQPNYNQYQAQQGNYAGVATTGGYASPQNQGYGNDSYPQQAVPQTYKPPQQQHSNIQNASDPHYIQLRNQALEEDHQMHQCFDAASRAYNAGEGGEAKELSNQGHAHQRKRDQLNDEAADWIFSANNASQPRGSIDLHGLYVQEAIERTERAVQDAQRQGLSELRIITGKGIHSNQGIAKIKPAIEKLMVKYNLAAHLDPHNSGTLVVNLQGGGSRDMSWVDEADRQSGDGECIIM